MALVEQSAPSAHDRLMVAVKSLPSGDLDKLCTGLEALVTAAGLRSQKPEMFFENAREHERTTT